MSKKNLCFITLMVIFSCSNLFAGNKPLNELDNLEFLGKNLYNDKNLSINNNQSCKSCHHNKVAFVDPANVKNPSKNVVSNGSVPGLTGALNAPTAGYATHSPKMYWDGELYIGGVFWNGRAAGHKEFWVFSGQTDAIHSPLAEQAQGPFLNPVEMALPSKAEVVYRVSIADYAYLFALAFGVADFNDIELTYDQIGYAIAAFESTKEFTEFNSDFDDTTKQRLPGEALFNGKAKCSACHITESGDSGFAEFTDYSYDNLGVPLNPIIADKGADPGLGGFILAVQNDSDALQSLKDMVGTAISEGEGSAVENWGKHKVSTLRNIAQTPPYAHNGFFPNLTAIVQFYNTRDVYACAEVGEVRIPVTPALLEQGFIPGYPEDEDNGYCWPAPEIRQNVNNIELGALGLTSDEVDQIVAFMESLSDNAN